MAGRFVMRPFPTTRKNKGKAAARCAEALADGRVKRLDPSTVVATPPSQIRCRVDSPKVLRP